MITISLCLIVKNEHDTLKNCLESIKDFVDEIIIVDTGSTDDTKEIAGKYTEKILNFTWIDDFAAARNFSFSQATMDYILWLDADDILMPEDQTKLLKLKTSLDDSIDSVTMIYNYSFDEYGNVSLRFRRNRLVKRNRQFKWHGPVHEYLAVDGSIFNSDIAVSHKRVHVNSGRNLSIFENRLKKGDVFSSRDRYYYANELNDNGFYEKAIENYVNFLDMKDGWIEDKISACYKITNIYSRLGNVEKELHYIWKSFELSAPRAEFCCRLGYHFLSKNELKNSIFWYKLASNLNKPEDNWGFFLDSCWTWLPNIQLCICYYRLGDYEKSYEHNEIARSFRPLDKNILYNKELLEGILKMENNSSETTINDKIDLSRPLRIVQVAPDYYPVPPLNYGGIERVVYNLTEELVKLGHEVYLYAPVGSKSSATIINYDDTDTNQQNIADFVQRTLPHNIDIIHDHTHDSVIGVRKLAIPTICTIHDSKYNIVDHNVYLSKRALKVVGKDHGAFVYNGIDVNEYQFSEEKEDYLLFLGTVNWHKGINYAIDVAEKSNEKLVIAGPIFNYEYYNKEIEPRIRKSSNIEYIGEVGGQRKQDLLKKAKCFLFPTSWEEPFGLVMIEAMACGTPVLAFPNGAVSEVMEGFPDLICSSVDEMVQKLNTNQFPKPKLLRDYVANRFTINTMAREYVKLYKKIITGVVNYNYANKLRKMEKYAEAIEYYKQFLYAPDFPQKKKIRICYELADIYSNLKDFEKEREFIFKSFEYDSPHAEFCCKLGSEFVQNNEFDNAIFWYDLATKLEMPKEKDEIISECCWTWIPLVQLCICYYKVGDYKKSYDCNELALSFLPTNEMLLNNRKLYDNIIKK